MYKLIQKYLRRQDGAIAVETAIVAPIMMLILLPAIDIGMQISTLQKMNKATDSGIEYVVNGGREETTLRAIVQDSFGGSINTNELQVLAYCGCVNTPENPDDKLGTIIDPQAGFYVKTSSQFVEDMCSTPCDDGEKPSELVELRFDRNVQGVWKRKSISSHLQTRIK